MAGTHHVPRLSTMASVLSLMRRILGFALA